MADLVQEFFKRDLSEAEQEVLSKLLEGSPEAAANYETLLEQNYLATGLPQPTLPKGLESLGHFGGGGLAGWSGSLKLLLAGLALAAAGTALWKFWPETKTEISTPIQQEAVSPAPEKSASPAKEAGRPPAQVQPLPAGPTQEGQELSVVLDAPQKSLVTVRILDPAGKEVRALYTGFVGAGRWNFQWDGLLQDGQAAGAGDYRIDVQAGEAHLSKDIRVKLQPPAP